jgi:putative oxidoreductase
MNPPTTLPTLPRLQAQDMPALPAWTPAWLRRLAWPVTTLLGRVALAGVFWQSGQTKVQGLAINLATGEFQLGWPRLSDNAVALFRDEYKLPLLPPELAAVMAASAEHLLPLMLLLGLGTRLAALGLLGMTAVIQLLVYPGAWPTHFSWAAVLLMLLWQGCGPTGLDALLARWRGAGPR